MACEPSRHVNRLRCDLKILNSSPNPFDFSSETTPNMASKMFAIVYYGWVDNSRVEIYCSNMYADDN